MRAERGGLTPSSEQPWAHTLCLADHHFQIWVGSFEGEVGLVEEFTVGRQGQYGSKKAGGEGKRGSLRGGRREMDEREERTHRTPAEP